LQLLAIKRHFLQEWVVFGEQNGSFGRQKVFTPLKLGEYILIMLKNCRYKLAFWTKWI